MSESIDVQSNVVSLADVRQARSPSASPAEPPQPPWHIREATWILREVATLESRFLTRAQTSLVIAMATWPRNVIPTPEQRASLKQIGDRVEAATTKQLPAPPTPPDAA